MTMARNQTRKRKGYPTFAAASLAGGKKISADALLVAAIVLSALMLLATFLPLRTSSLPAPVRDNGTLPAHQIGSAVFGATGTARREG